MFIIQNPTLVGLPISSSLAFSDNSSPDGASAIHQNRGYSTARFCYSFKFCMLLMLFIETPEKKVLFRKRWCYFILTPLWTHCGSAHWLGIRLCRRQPQSCRWKSSGHLVWPQTAAGWSFLPCSRGPCIHLGRGLRHSGFFAWPAGLLELPLLCPEGKVVCTCLLHLSLAFRSNKSTYCCLL